MKGYRPSLTFSILASLAFLLILTWLLLSLISFKTAEQDLFAQKREHARIVLSMLLSYRANGNMSSAADIHPVALERVASLSDFAGFVLIDSSGSPMMMKGEMSMPDRRLHEVAGSGTQVEMFSDDRQILYIYAPIMGGGAARLALSLEGELTRLQRSRQIFLAYFVLDFALLLLFGALLLGRFIVRPVRRLLNATERIAGGDYSHRVQVEGGREIGELAESFNAMVDELRRERDEVERHVASVHTANIELLQARAEAIRSEKMASVGILAAGMAHEIGTPLAAIMGYAGMLREELASDPEKTDYLRRIIDDSGRIDRIVRGLLDYARPTRGELVSVNAGDVISEVMELAGSQGLLKQAEASMTLEDGLPMVVADRGQLQQVLLNLVINACDAMPHGGRLDVRAVLAQPDDGACGIIAKGVAESCVRIDVTDSGEGIAPENLDRVFDPFFTTKEPGRGTGLGLALSARIIDSFGGRITVVSEVGKGTTFTVWLPVKQGPGTGPKWA
ncbi:MAG: HAMP domain-containing protein [Geobacter sp.]|nr:HAMP domain-containing protein [Geobacter sp.]